MITEMINDADGMAEIQRNELANRVGCVPSQINYVITSRFTPEQGYIVESRRGGGGYIRITRKVQSENEMLAKVIAAIGDKLNEETARLYAASLYHNNIISGEAARLISAACCDRVYREVPQSSRDALRADIAKQMLMTLMEND
jgi:transcriptional regulator CtsR